MRLTIKCWITRRVFILGTRDRVRGRERAISVRMLGGEIVREGSVEDTFLALD